MNIDSDKFNGLNKFIADQSFYFVTSRFVGLVRKPIIRPPFRKQNVSPSELDFAKNMFAWP